MEIMKTRRSIRKYTDEPVSREQVERIAAAAQLAPSWKNSQTARFTAVMDPGIKKKISENGVFGYKKNSFIIGSAPVLMILSTVEGISGFEPDGSFTTEKGTHWQSFDAGSAAYAFCLAAKEEGLGTCIMGLFDEEYISELIGLPTAQSISALIALGHPDSDPEMPERKELEEILTVIE